MSKGSRGKKTGKRFELLLVEIKRNNYSAKLPLTKLEDYFRKRNENYLFVTATEGRPKESFLKMWKRMLELGFVENPLKVLFEINQIALQQKKATTAELLGLAGLNTFEEFGLWLAKKN